MDVQEFQTKWRGVTRTERSAAQEHFIDICRLLGQPTPAEADRAGAFYTFERGVRTVRGGNGFADVWWRGKFGWEYKRNRANLDEAYQQLLLYREDLENPPLLVVSDFERFQIHTNFTGTAKRVYSFLLNELDKPENLAALRAVFEDPDRLRPNRTVQAVTEDVAGRFGQLALSMQQRGVATSRFTAGIQRITDRSQRGVVFAPHLLGQECQLAFVRDMRGDALRIHDVRQQVVGDRQFRQLRRAQPHQLLAQRQHIQRRAPLLAATGAEEFPTIVIASAHRSSIASSVQRLG